MDLLIIAASAVALLVLLGLAFGRLVDALTARSLRRTLERAVARHALLNQHRREAGLDDFPDLSEFERLAKEHALAVRPEGLQEHHVEPRVVDELDVTLRGLFVAPEEKRDEEFKDVFILGEFGQRWVPSMVGTQPRKLFLNRGIVLYFGSFMAVYGLLPTPQVIAQLYHTVEHELRHLTDAETGVPYERSLASQDDLHREQYRNLSEKA